MTQLITTFLSVHQSWRFAYHSGFKMEIVKEIIKILLKYYIRFSSLIKGSKFQFFWFFSFLILLTLGWKYCFAPFPMYTSEQINLLYFLKLVTKVNFASALNILCLQMETKGSTTESRCSSNYPEIVGEKREETGGRLRGN